MSSAERTAIEYLAEIVALTDELERTRDERDRLLADLEEFRVTVADISESLAAHPSQALRIVKP